MIPLRDANPAHGRPVVTWLLLAANVAVFLYQFSLGQGRRGVEFILDYGFVPALFATEPLSVWHTLFTSLFLHGGWGHLLSNMVFLLVFGDNVEDRVGHVRFLVFYLVGGAVATGAHALLGGLSLVPLVGASGAISSVLGAYILFYPQQRVMTFIPPLLVPWLLLSFFARVPRFFMLWLPAWIFIGYWAFLQLLEAGASFRLADDGGGGVAWWAHVGGFLFGLVVGPLLARARRVRSVGQAGSIRP